MMANDPQLLIIAGPNGAGKSTYSKDLSPPDAFIFDADKEIARIEARFPGLPAESISYATEQYFLDCVEDALKKQADFTIETNFRDAGLMDTVDRFKDKGYQAGLVYLGLRNIRQSIDRVNERVNDGGHFVDKGSISYNYTEGLKNLEYFADRFNTVELIDASGSLYELKSLLSVQNGRLVYVGNRVPEWAEAAVGRIKNYYRYNSPDRDDNGDYFPRPRR